MIADQLDLPSCSISSLSLGGVAGLSWAGSLQLGCVLKNSELSTSFRLTTTESRFFSLGSTPIMCSRKFGISTIGLPWIVRLRKDGRFSSIFKEATFDKKLQCRQIVRSSLKYAKSQSRSSRQLWDRSSQARFLHYTMTSSTTGWKSCRDRSLLQPRMRLQHTSFTFIFWSVFCLLRYQFLPPCFPKMFCSWIDDFISGTSLTGSAFFSTFLPSPLSLPYSPLASFSSPFSSFFYFPQSRGMSLRQPCRGIMYRISQRVFIQRYEKSMGGASHDQYFFLTSYFTSIILRCATTQLDNDI